MGKREYKGKRRGRRVFRLSALLLGIMLVGLTLSNNPLSPVAAALRGAGNLRVPLHQAPSIATPTPAEVVLSPSVFPAEPPPVQMPEGTEEDVPPVDTTAPEDTAPQVGTPPVADTAQQPPPTTSVEDGWFNDAVFLGDSRMEGFKLYAGLPKAQYLTSVGATVDSVFQKTTAKGKNGKITIMDALAEMKFSKIYLTLGMNELGWNSGESFIEHYARVVDRVLEINPEATVYISALFPVTKEKDAKKGYVNNARISQYNTLLAELATEKGVTFLDASPAVVGEDGYLPENYSFDGVHLTPEACKLWREYLKTHTA